MITPEMRKLRETQVKYYRKLNPNALEDRFLEIQKVIDRESFKLVSIRQVMDECIEKNIPVQE